MSLFESKKTHIIGDDVGRTLNSKRGDFWTYGKI